MTAYKQLIAEFEDKVVNEVMYALQQGQTLNNACVYIGVPKKTYFRYLKRSRERSL